MIFISAPKFITGNFIAVQGEYTNDHEESVIHYRTIFVSAEYLAKNNCKVLNFKEFSGLPKFSIEALLANSSLRIKSIGRFIDSNFSSRLEMKKGRNI